jgi:dTDP-4-dehydrorhamnose reductase
MMGGGEHKDKKFINKLMKQIRAGKREIFVVNDKDGTPTYTHDFAKNVRLILEKELWGLYNLVCNGQTSRLEVARELIRLLGKDDEIKITEVQSAFFKNEYFAQRPACERLVNKKLQLRGLNIMRDWQIALREYLDDYYAGDMRKS